MLASRCFAAAAALGLSACAAAMPGYVPEKTGRSASIAEKMKPFDSGDVGAGGAYEPSAAERGLDCKRLTGSMRIIVSRLADQPNRVRPSDISANAQTLSSNITGRAKVDLDSEAERERARFAAYNKLLVEKNCPTLDLDAELAKKR